MRRADIALYTRKAAGLDASDVERLDETLRPDAVSGPRYNERNMAMVDR